MSALPNPLQELAEKLIEEFRERGGRHIEGMLTASLGTLLQAERAATLQPIHDLADKWADPEFWKNTGNTMDSSDCAGELLNISEATPEASSALSAVVQRARRKSSRNCCGNLKKKL